MRYVGEPTGGQRRTKNKPARSRADAGHADDLAPPPPRYEQAAGKKTKKTKKGSAAAAARDDDQRNVRYCSSVSVTSQLMFLCSIHI